MAKNENNKSVAHNMLGDLAASYKRKQQDEIKDNISTENKIIKKEIEEVNISKQPEPLKEAVKAENIIYKTKNYDMFLPYPKAELRLELHQGQAREQLKNSIEAHGITTPIKVCPIANDKFVILSGHNRLDIAKELGIEVPYVVFNNLTEDVKDEIVAEEHILNRQQKDFKPSQMMKLLLAIKKTSKNQQELLEKTAVSKTGTYRYLSLELLLPELLYEWVDTQKLSLMSAEGLSKNTTKEQQKIFYNYITSNNFRIIQEKPMKKLLENKNSAWDDSLFNAIFKETVKKQKTYKIQIDESVIKETLTSEESKNIDELIIKLLYEYKKGNVIIK